MTMRRVIPISDIKPRGRGDGRGTDTSTRRVLDPHSVRLSPDTRAALERFRRQVVAETESELGVRGLPLSADDLVRCALARALNREI